MKLENRKLLMPLLGAAAFAALSTGTFADDRMQKKSQYERRQSTTSSQKNGNNQFRQITPNAGPTVHNGADIFITANFIYWHANQAGLTYAFPSAESSATSNVAPLRRGVIGEDWGPGFKVGLGLDTAHDGWDVYAQYTWNSFRQNSSTTYPLSQAGTSKMLNPNDGQNLLSDKGTSTWKLRYNKIDLMLGRNFYLSQYLTMRPAAGLTGTWQHQNVSTTYRRLTTAYAPAGLTPAPTLDGTLRNDLVLKQYGIGVRMGSDFAWYFTKQFSIFTDLYANLYWTDYTTQSNKVTLNNGDATTPLSKVYVNQSDDDYYAVKFTSEAEIGLMWETYFCEHDYHFAAKVSWEVQNWINWARFGNALTMQNHDLTLQGLNVKLRFDF